MFEKQLKSPLRSPLMRAILAGSGVSTPSYYLNLTIPGDSPVTIADGQARGTITSTYNAVITASMSPSRITGVAPLYVNFDMTGTTSTDSTNPTHECFFATDFGDTGAGTWANGVQSSGLTSKNAGYGPVTGHVYETPGTYTVTMSVTDGVNTVTKTGTIVVQDPDVVYAGTDTICISHSGNFTGAPSGAAQVNTAGNTDMYAAWNTYKASNKRILFCKADTWTASATVDAGGLSNMLVGGYGTGMAHTFSPGTTMVSVTPTTGYFRTFQGGGATDVRFCEFKIAGSAINDGCGSTSATSTQVTWYKCEVRGATESFANYPSLGLNSLYKHDQSCFYECLSDNLYGYAGQNPPSFTGATAAIGTPGIFTATAHNFNRFNKVRLFGTAPAGLSLATDYYISGTNLTANTFSLSATRWPDTPLAITGTGSCDVTAIGLSGGVAGFIAITNGGVMGCYFDNGNHGEQTLRIPYINISHISNNYIARPNQNKNILKMHPRGYNNTIGVSTGYSEKIIISGNVFDLRGGYSYNEPIPNNGQTATMVGGSYIIAGYGNSGEGVDERMQNVIVENNITYGCLGNPKDNPHFISAHCRDFTIRNNIADFSVNDRTTSYTAPYIYTNIHFANVTTSTAEQTVGVRICNNTLYSNLANAETAYFVRIIKATVPNPEATDITIKNNLWYTPFHANASRTAYYDQYNVAPTTVATNNTDSVAGGDATTPPNFAVQPPVALSDWRPTTGYAVDGGATVPVLRDFNMGTRVGGTYYDIGAVLP